MNEVREKILQSIRSALTDVPVNERQEDVTVKRDYRKAGQLSAYQRFQLFAERIAEYKANVSIVVEKKLASTIDEICMRHRIKKLAVPTGISNDWLPVGVEVLYDIHDNLSPHEIDKVCGVITCCHLAVAQTGTLVLAGGPEEGRRMLTLLPDLHLCIVYSNQIVETLPEAYSKINPSVPVTFISGPSATSDIELNRIEGVHGPRKLEVIIIK